MTETHLTYFDAPYLYKSTATVLATTPTEDGLTDIILDASIFYPQGGGQPYDQGSITGSAGSAQISAVRFIDGVVHHFGSLSGTLTVGEQVQCSVDIARRELNSRYHSGGHLIDFALNNLGYDWEPHKGHHYPNEAYDEYVGSIDDAARDVLLPKLQAEIDRLIFGGAPVTMKIMSGEDLEKTCRFVPAILPAGKPTRGAIVHFNEHDGGDRGIPCGGTHVPNLSLLNGMKINKIKSKKGMIKVSYALTENV